MASRASAFNVSSVRPSRPSRGSRSVGLLPRQSSEPRRTDKRCPPGIRDSGGRRPVPPEHVDGPLHLPEFARVASTIRMEPLRALPESLIDRSLGRPSASEAGRMDPDLAEPQDPQGCLDAFRLQIELPQMREHPTGVVAALDAVPLMLSADGGSGSMVVAAGETEELADHGLARRTGLMGLAGLAVGQSLYSSRPR